ncbi:MAG: urease subunit beta [Desulfitobacteriaceae bacterium]
MDMKPGEYFLSSGVIEANKGRKTVKLPVANTGDRPIQVGSHFHFFEVNKFLDFDRAQVFGMRLNIPAGTAIRFEPGEEKDITVVEFGGKKTVYGLNNLTNGAIRSADQIRNSLVKASLANFRGSKLD